MRFADDENRCLYDGDYNNVQPRLGFAYALNNKTSIRGAYGMFYMVSRHTVKGEVGTAFGFTDTSIPWTLDSGRTQYATIANPFPAGLTLPPGRDSIAFLGRGAGTPLPKDNNPQYQQWNFSVQREVPGHGVVEVELCRHQGHAPVLRPGRRGVGPQPARPHATGEWAGTRSTSLVPNPFYGIITNPAATSYNQPTIQLNRLLRPYRGIHQRRRLPGVAQHRQLHVPRPPVEVREALFPGTERDRPLHHLEDDQRLRRFRLATWNSSPADRASRIYFNLRNERSLSAFDVPQRLVVSFDYQLPMGRGRTFGKNMNRVLDGVVGGWELSCIIIRQIRARRCGITQSAEQRYGSAASGPTWSAIPASRVRSETS